MQDKDLVSTINLLKDQSLVWSEDMEVMRRPIAALLAKIEQTGTHQFDDELEKICDAMLNVANTPVQIPDAMEAWVQSGFRQFGIYEAMGVASPTFREAIRKLFRFM